MNTEKLTWYVARSGGIVAWVLLALGLVLGLLLSSRLLGRRASPAWILSIHRFLGGLSVIFTAVHVAAIMMDDFVDFGVVEVLVPWASSWNPGAVAWGIIAMYLAVAIELTSFAMKRLPRGLWRAVHWTSAPLFVMATVHGYQAGTDAGRAFIVAIVIAMLVLTVLTVVRIVMARRRPEPRDPRKLVEAANDRRRRAGGVVVDPEAPPATTDGPPQPSAPQPPPPPAQPRVPEPASSGVFGDLTEALPTVGPTLHQPVRPRQVPTPSRPGPALPAPAPAPAPAPEHSLSGAFFDQDAADVMIAPAPGWKSGTAPAPHPEPTAPAPERNEGPVPGVWKRSADPGEHAQN